MSKLYDAYEPDPRMTHKVLPEDKACWNCDNYVRSTWDTGDWFGECIIKKRRKRLDDSCRKFEWRNDEYEAEQRRDIQREEDLGDEYCGSTGSNLGGFREVESDEW